LALSSYLDQHVAFFEEVAREGRENPSSHRRKICQNYLEHAALEYVGRWDEVLQPARTVENPIYRIRIGTPEAEVHDGMAAVRDYYSRVTPSDGVFVMPNSDSHFAVSDWGFSTFLTVNLFQTGVELQEQGIDPADPDGHYILQTNLGYWWSFDSDARLIGENVYELEPTKVVKISASELIAGDDMKKLVKPYLPHSRQVGSSDVFRSAL
jgi:hypothetical protein